MRVKGIGLADDWCNFYWAILESEQREILLEEHQISKTYSCKMKFHKLKIFDNIYKTVKGTLSHIHSIFFHAAYTNYMAQSIP